MNKYLVSYGKPRYLAIMPYKDELNRGIKVIASTVRGDEIAVLIGKINEKQEAEYRLMRNASEHGDGMSKGTEPAVTDAQFVDFASDLDINEASAYRLEEHDIFNQAKEILMPHNLDMKLIDVEYLYKKHKLFFYFSSDNRVDFRAYVRDLARVFKTRIELRQIGVRDEAKIIRGMSPCGRQCCCSYWLSQLAPICIKMVKEQNLALNPAKLSGICGRLMCCMSFEQEVYHEVWENLPAPGTKIKTPDGNILVSGIDLRSNSLLCMMPTSGLVKVPKEKFEEFKVTVESGNTWINAEEAVIEPPFRIYDSSNGLLSDQNTLKTSKKSNNAKQEQDAAEISETQHKSKHKHRKKPDFIIQEVTADDDTLRENNKKEQQKQNDKPRKSQIEKSKKQRELPKIIENDLKNVNLDTIDQFENKIDQSDVQISHKRPHRFRRHKPSNNNAEMNNS